MFADKHIHAKPNNDISKSDLHAKFLQFTTKMKIPSVVSQQFTKKLKEYLAKNEIPYQELIDKDRMWRGIEYYDEKQPEPPKKGQQELEDTPMVSIIG